MPAGIQSLGRVPARPGLAQPSPAHLPCELVGPAARDPRSASPLAGALGLARPARARTPRGPHPSGKYRHWQFFPTCARTHLPGDRPSANPRSRSQFARRSSLRTLLRHCARAAGGGGRAAAGHAGDGSRAGTRSAQGTLITCRVPSGCRSRRDWPAAALRPWSEPGAAH